jgi:predicted nucleic acid-binding protein
MGTPSFFLDTSYVIALELSDDQHHDAAISHWEGLSDLMPTIVTTSYVFDEIVTFFNSRNLHERAIDIGSRLLSSSHLMFVHVDESLFNLGWQYFQQHDDKRYSLTDCISFALMNQMGIHRALAFDRDFVQAGFQRVP